MVKITLRSNQHSMAINGLVFFGIVILMQRVSATDFNVGGANGWTVPTDGNKLSYNQWAEMKRFRIGDSLSFVCQSGKDSVLQVSKDDFANCNITTPIATFNDRSTTFKFTQSGPYYFISGIQDNCKKNEKLVVIVMAQRGQQSSNSTQTPPASPPSSPPPAPVEVVPTPAPVGEESPSPPPPPPYKNGASSMLMSFTSVGAFVGSSFLLVL
ncbi:hypothetical protein GIB67_009903 [Kingdonia uniflora]|uniref:Phytocyanin domain-containing protein n=1 Tax=Kingdonia uniflora TaxID=39325 RepID=A0A7J7L493_9MAGN|nr:hypothetical protein GIB67_009903 [Kingdonia uniflora]